MKPDNLPMVPQWRHRRGTNFAAIGGLVLGFAFGVVVGTQLTSDAAEALLRSEAAQTMELRGDLAVCSAGYKGLLDRAALATATVDAARCEVAALRELYGECLQGNCIERLPDSLCLALARDAR